MSKLTGPFGAFKEHPLGGAAKIGLEWVVASKNDEGGREFGTCVCHCVHEARAVALANMMNRECAWLDEDSKKKTKWTEVGECPP